MKRVRRSCRVGETWLGWVELMVDIVERIFGKNDGETMVEEEEEEEGRAGAEA